METLKIKYDANDIYPFSDKTDHPFYPGAILTPLPFNNHNKTWKDFWSNVTYQSDTDLTVLYTHTDGAGNPEENAWAPIVHSFFQGVDFAYAEAGRIVESKNGVVTQYIESLTKNLLFDFTHEDRSARGTLEKAVRQLEAEGIDFRLFGTAWETLYQKIVLARATAESLGLSVSILTHDVSEIPDIANFIEDYCTDNTSLMIFLFLVIAEQAGRDNSLAKGSDVGDYIRLLPCTESIIPQLTDSETEFLNDLLATLRQDLTIFNSFVLINRNLSAIKTKHNAEDIRSTIIKLLTPAKQ